MYALTFHLDHVDKSGRHNDRNFDISKAPHIDADSIKNDILANYVGKQGETFRDAEIRFYEEHFGDQIRKQNEKNAKANHRERNKTLEQYMLQRGNRIEDGWIQIGTVKDHVDGETLWKCFEEYKKRFDELCGGKGIFLNASLHVDERTPTGEYTPHIQFRRVWLADKTDGTQYLSKSGALKQLGFESNDPQQGLSKTNNLAKAFTYYEREVFSEICRAHGIEISLPKEPGNFIPHNQYKEIKAAESLKKLNNEIQQKQNEIEELQRTAKTIETDLSVKNEELKDVQELYETLYSLLENDTEYLRQNAIDLEQLRKMSRREKIKVLKAYLRAQSDALKIGISSVDVEGLPYRDDYYSLYDFIEAEGLMEKYEEQRDIEEKAEQEKEKQEEQEKKEAETPGWL